MGSRTASNAAEVRQIESSVASVWPSFPEVMLAYLFGSRVEGTPGGLSDYDFAVVLEKAAHIPEVRARLAHELGRALCTPRIDLVVLNRAPIELAFAVIADGNLLRQADDFTRVEYEARVMGLYSDYLPVLRAQRREIFRGGGHATRVRRYREALERAERTLGAIRAAQGQEAR